MLKHSHLLAIIEDLEAARINLGLYSATLSLDHLMEVLTTKGEACSQEELEGALQKLISEGEVIECSTGCYRSRIAETVRVLRTLRQRFQGQSLANSPLLIEGIRVEFRQRRRPKRDAVLFSKAIPLEVTPRIRSAFEQAIGFSTLSGFQERAIDEIYHCANRSNPDNRAFIVAGDTGAGKTEGFLFPILMDIASEPTEIRAIPGVRAVLVYPRIRLAFNQLARLLRYTTRFAKQGGPRLTIGIQNGNVPSDANALQEKWESRVYHGKKQFLYPQLEKCLQDDCQGHYWLSADDPSIENGCPTLVCDKCGHKIDTLCVTQKALSQMAPDFLVITDVSLSQWMTRENYAHLWGLWDGSMKTLPPRYLVLDEIHLYEGLKGAHVARVIKRFQARTQFAAEGWGEKCPQKHPIFIGVSATLRDEQRFLAKILDVDPCNTLRYGKLRVIKPKEEELELTEGRERYIFLYPKGLSPTSQNAEYRVTDQTAAIQILMAAMHNLKKDIEWRGLAFFDSLNDLQQFSLNYDPSATGQASMQDIARSANQQELWRIRTDKASCKDACQCLGAFEECQRFQEGDCWIFAKLHGWNQPLRVAAPVYADQKGRSSLEHQDLIPTSPSLEVGFDDESIQLVYQHKAPHNAASFIQRRGRAGRDPNDSPVIITLLWPYRQDDAFYFFRPEALYEPIFDDAPLNAANFNVQQTHVLLAFFDLLACFRKQLPEELGESNKIYDFTRASDTFMPAGAIDSFRTGPGTQVVAHNKRTGQQEYFSGKALESVKVESNTLLLKGWLGLRRDLYTAPLLPAWDLLSQNKLFENYLDLSGIAGESFKRHHKYPFPGAIAQFGRTEWHTLERKTSRNWLESYRDIDWMLQGSQGVTTVPVHFSSHREGHESELGVTFGLTEFLPGNVSYRLRQGSSSHWIPLPPNGASTFLFPKNPDDKSGSDDPQYLPVQTDIAGQRESIFGVPKYLDERFPGLPLLKINHLRAEEFHRPGGNWYFVPDPQDPLEGSAHWYTAGEKIPEDAFAIGSRSSARASSIIVPHVVTEKGVEYRQLQAPFDKVFVSVGGYLEEGRAMLGYTRAFYEMAVEIKSADGKKSASLTRCFYPPKPKLDEKGHPQPTLIGYEVETQGICFHVIPEFLAESRSAILEDTSLRMRMRRNFAVYHLAPQAGAYGVFISRFIDYIGIAIDYWLAEVVPLSGMRPLTSEADARLMCDFYARTHVLAAGALPEFEAFLGSSPSFLQDINQTIELAFKETKEFGEFVESVTLHSLASLLKNHIARLAGVSSGELVAYADLPVLDKLDQTTYPRILILDTVEGGSGGISQAFERLDLTTVVGSLWWTLQQDLGHCPFAAGEGMVKTVLSRATAEQLESVREAKTEEALAQLLGILDLDHPTEEAVQQLGRVLFGELNLGDGLSLVPALIIQELQRIEASLRTGIPGVLTREWVVQHAVLHPDPEHYPEIAALREALASSGAPAADLDRELGLQLLTLFKLVCEDGCPVCLSADSDIEHHLLAKFLNSRQALRKVREVLLQKMPQPDCLAKAANLLLKEKVVNIQASPGDVKEPFDRNLGIGVFPNIDESGQIHSASAVLVDEDALTQPDRNWKWGNEEHYKYQVRNGVKVRSRAEYIIATQLLDNGIPFTYEPPVYYSDEKGDVQTLHPDFLLVAHNIYLEYWGKDDSTYLASRAFKEEIYQQKGLAYISIEKDEIEHEVFLKKVKAQLAKL